jgi:PKD repeat protein
LIIRKASCDELQENNYCYEFFEKNAVKNDSIPFRYDWKCGDGSTGTGSTVDHCFAGPGTYIVQLDVVNLLTKEVLYNQKSYNLDIKNIEQAYISVPEIVIAGTAIEMSADSTNLPGWNIGQYYWNFGDETISTGKDVLKTYLKPGNYNIQLILSTESEPGAVIKEACVSKNITVIGKP